MLKNDIGVNAGIIWHLLEEYRQLSIREIGEHTNYEEKLILFSLGWLARENKIVFIEGQHGDILVKLEFPSSEIYY